jgi:hypothetical protein
MTSTSVVQEILESIYPVRSEIIPCFLGEPGIGKTQGIHEFAEKHGVDVYTFNLIHSLPSELSGIRMPDLEHDELRVLDDAKMAALKDGDVLFFDEILEAPQQLWSAVLTLLQDRTMASGKKLPDVLIVAASNKTATSKQIPPSVRDRFIWFDLTFDFNTWSKWFEDKYNVKPVTTLKDMFFKDNGYNLLTPRKFGKLYEWLEANNWEGVTKTAISDAFGMVLLDKLMATHNNMGIHAQIARALKIQNIELSDTVMALPLDELLENLMQRPEWYEIQRALSDTEVLEETCMF